VFGRRDNLTVKRSEILEQVLQRRAELASLALARAEGIGDGDDKGEDNEGGEGDDKGEGNDSGGDNDKGEDNEGGGDKRIAGDGIIDEDALDDDALDDDTLDDDALDDDTLDDDTLLDLLRPRTRADCERGIRGIRRIRPCPFVGCRHNLYMDVSPTTGTITLNFPNIEPDKMPPALSCALDVAERDGVILEKVAKAMGVTRERARQVESAALRKLKLRATKDGDLFEYYSDKLVGDDEVKF
jgi:hypothetical protein